MLLPPEFLYIKSRMFWNPSPQQIHRERDDRDRERYRDRNREHFARNQDSKRNLERPGRKGSSYSISHLKSTKQAWRTSGSPGVGTWTSNSSVPGTATRGPHLRATESEIRSQVLQVILKHAQV